MHSLEVRLFGKFSTRSQGRKLRGLDSSRVQELFCYLLLHRNRHHPRETLASLLWEASSSAQAKKYLRQALWQLQQALSTQVEEAGKGILQIEHDWIRINPEADLWLDVAVFEEAFFIVQGMRGEELPPKWAKVLEEAVGLYRGDLLDGWYQDWCLFERERLQNMWIATLDKLMAFCEAHQSYEQGLNYGMKILRRDRARERTHRKLMRLNYLAGDRTGALRQYARCCAALEEELGVKPAKRTEELYQQILADSLEEDPPTIAPAPLPKVIARLGQLRKLLTDVQQHVSQDLDTIEKALDGH